MLNHVEKTNTLWKNYKGYGSTHNSRASFEELYRAFNNISIESVLTYGDKIPRDSRDELFTDVSKLDITNPIAYFQESLYKKIPIVKKHVQIQTTPISSNCDHSFVIAIDGQQVKNIIPFDFSDEGIYNYTLTDSLGKEIPFGVCDWIVDTNSALLTFNNGVPAGVDAEHPPIITFYQYVGPVGEKSFIDALALGVPNINIPTGATVVDVTNPIVDFLEGVEKDYFAKYKFNGTDTTPGIGLQYNLLTQVVDTVTSDPLMGYDDNSHSQVVNLLTHKIGICEKLDPDFTIFVSEGVPVGTYNVQVFEEAEREGVVKVDVEDGFFVLKAEPGIYSIEVIESDKLYSTLLVKDNITQEFELFYPRQDLSLTIQVPIFANLNTLPPHLKLTTLATSYTDHITPQYYGPRVADFVIAAADSTNAWRSADYVVYNDEKSNLQTAIKQAEGNHIFVRNGQYFAPDQTIIENITFEGETKKGINIYGKNNSTVYVQQGSVLKHLQFFNAILYVEGDVVLKDILCDKIIINGGQVICKNMFANTVNVLSGNITTFDSYIQNLNINSSEITNPPEEGSGDSNDSNESLSVFSLENVEEGTTVQLFNTSIVQNCNNAGALIELYGSYIYNFKNEAGAFFIQSSRIGKLNVLDTLPESIVDTTAVSVVERLPEFIKIDASYVTKFSSAIDRPVYPDTYTMPFYTSFEKRVYAKIPKPFVYHEDTNILELTLDTIEHTMFINEKGELQCRFFTTKEIKIDSTDKITTQVEKIYGEHADTVLDKKRPETVDEAILDLYWSKADLVKGKLPIDQLPDSVAYGGLSFVGMWQFEDHNGKYPTFDDIDTSFESDDEYTSLQNGWFFIVSASNKEDDPVYPQQAVLQKGEEEAQEYTAGDWLIYSNGIFKKLDRAYLDPVYSRLPELAPVKDGENVKWSVDEGGTGLLKLDYETLAEAIRLLNEALLKLSPDRPTSIQNLSVVMDEENTTATSMLYIEIGNGELLTYLNNPQKTSWETGTGVIACKQQGVHDTLPLEHCFYSGLSSDIKIWDNEEDITDTGTIERFDPYVKYRLGFKTPTPVMSAEVNVSIPLEGNDQSYITNHAIKYTQYNLTPHSPFVEDKDILEGETSIYQFSHRKFYRLEDCKIQKVDESSVNISDLNNSLKKYKMGGVGAILKGQSINGTFTVKNFSKYKSIGKDANVEVRAFFNDKELELNVGSLLLDLKDSKVHSYDLKVDFTVELDITQPFAEFGNLSVKAQVTNFGVTTEEVEVLSIKDLHVVDPIIFEHVVESGNIIYPTLGNSTTEKERENVFGENYIFGKYPLVCRELQYIDVLGLQGWGWTDRAKDIYQFTTINDVEYQNVAGKGIEINDDEYRFITFKKSLDTVKDLSGFTILLEWDGNAPIPEIDSMTGTFKNIIVQNCVTSSEAKHVYLSDANKPIPVFFEAEFNQGEPSCYPGYSTLYKRYITFGRKPVPVKDIYVRIGLPKSGGFVLRNLKIVESTQPQH